MITVANKRVKGVVGEYVGRPSPLGNPFHLRCEDERDEVIEKYAQWLLDQTYRGVPRVVRELERLRGIWQAQGSLVLVCWCAPKRCHADVIRLYLESLDAR